MTEPRLTKEVYDEVVSGEAVLTMIDTGETRRVRVVKHPNEGQGYPTAYVEVRGEEPLQRKLGKWLKGLLKA